MTAMIRNAATLCLLTAALFAAGTARSDDRTDTATNLGSDRDEARFNDNVGDADYIDYYRFQFTAGRALEASLTGLQAEAYLYLIDANGSWVATGNNGTGFSALRRDLAAGTYYLMVYGPRASTPYGLVVRSWIPVTGGTTRDLGTIDGMGGVSARASASGTIAPQTGWVDCWFTLPDIRGVTVNANISTGAALFDAQQRLVEVAQNGRISRTLGAGRHFVRLFRHLTQTIPYGLELVAATPDTGDTAGNGQAAARNLGSLGAQVITIDEFVGRYDFDDWFVVNVPAGITLNLQLTQTGENANVWIHDAAGRELARSSNLGRADEAISFRVLQGGAHFVRVGIATRNAPYWENSRYRLNIGAWPAPGSGTGTIPTGVPLPGLPRDLGGNSALYAASLFQYVPQGTALQDSIGGFDPQDWYRIPIQAQPFSNTRGVTILLEGLTANADLFVYRQRGDGSLVQVASATRTGSQSERLDLNLEVRDINGYMVNYLVQITSSSFIATPYALTVQVP